MVIAVGHHCQGHKKIYRNDCHRERHKRPESKKSEALNHCLFDVLNRGGERVITGNNIGTVQQPSYYSMA